MSRKKKEKIQEEYYEEENDDYAQIERNKRIRGLFFLNIIFVSLLFVYILGMMINHKKISYSAYNQRTTLDNPAVNRGNILSRDYEILATTQEDGVRVYPQEDSLAHTVGYYDYGRVGIENIYGIEMENVNLEIYRYFVRLFGVQLNGNNVVTTIDVDIQNYIYDKLKNKKGAAVVLDANDGDILAMVSTPSFNPNTVKADWDDISTDEKNTPLINRTVQGLYPPGSTFKAITALSFMRSNPNYIDYIYNCTGEITIEDTTIECYNHKAHGEVNLEKALTVSCNTYFVSLYNEMPPEDLEKTANDVMFNESLDFILPYKDSSFGFTDDDDTSVYMRTYIGQGNTLVTPLFMAQYFQAIANDGIMLEPHLVEHIESSGGMMVDETKTKKIKRIMTQEEANTLTLYLSNVTGENGTASSFNSLDFRVAGKTGSAENAHGNDHGWFVGFAPAENPQFVIAVMYENNGGSHNMINDAKDIFKYVYEDYNMAEE